MLARKAERPNPDSVDTVIGKSTFIQGTLTSQGTLRVDGRLEGEIIGDGDVFIGQDARVVAKIKARHVVLAGHVDGDVEAAGKLEIGATGVLVGNVKVSQLVVEEGGVLEGSSSFRRRQEDKGSAGEGS
ncbi:MAG: polymer-forming cytoskeletal protein [Bacillota bacterium]|jgi:cytoskeletal protein CcmA (bactofilin family)|nr:polymer-forming cytoskeletal protein [Bacillota bacterium]